MKTALAILLVTLSTFAYGEETWEWAPHLPEGKALPDFTSYDHQGERTSLTDIQGQKGTLLYFNRSTDW